MSEEILDENAPPPAWVAEARVAAGRPPLPTRDIAVSMDDLEPTDRSEPSEIFSTPATVRVEESPFEKLAFQSIEASTKAFGDAKRDALMLAQVFATLDLARAQREHTASLDATTNAPVVWKLNKETGRMERIDHG